MGTRSGEVRAIGEGFSRGSTSACGGGKLLYKLENFYKAFVLPMGHKKNKRSTKGELDKKLVRAKNPDGTAGSGRNQTRGHKQCVLGAMKRSGRRLGFKKVMLTEPNRPNEETTRTIGTEHEQQDLK